MSVLTPSQIARMAHEVNRAYCAALGDHSQVPWEEAPLWQKDSAIAGVKAQWYVREPNPALSHEGWLAHKIADGWTYGPVKDAERKTHPCMVPYAELPPEQRAKDVLFVAVVQAALSTPPAPGREG
jgi:hypothetical protein